MTVAVATAEPADTPLRRCAAAPPMPPAPPMTIAETGLHPDTLAQLMLKTLVAGESSGTGARRAHAPAVFGARPLVEHARVEQLVEVRGTAGTGTAGYRYALTDLGRERAAPVPRNQPVRRPRAGAAGRSTSPRCALAWRRRRLHRPRAPARRASPHLIVSPSDARAARPGGQRRQGAVSLRPARKRQDRHRRGHRPRARRRHVHAVRDRRRRPDHHDVRSDQPRSLDGRPPASTASSRSAPRDRRWVRIRRPVVDRRRRADARHARPDVQPDRQVLRGADPDEGQRRRVPGRRLRPPAHPAARTC